jgi:AcrR family transcriptional regulator
MIDQDSVTESKRQALIDAGRELFLKNTYTNISIRRIAEKAKVNSALIAYYFGSKGGLFREVLSSYLSHNLDRLELATDDLSHDSLYDFFLNFYQSMPPEFTQLILRTVLFERSEMREWIMNDIFSRVLNLATRTSQRFVDESGEAYDPHLVRTLVQSLLVMPKVLQPIIEELEPGRINDEFYEKLAEMNSQILTQFFNLDKSM